MEIFCGGRSAPNVSRIVNFDKRSRQSMDDERRERLLMDGLKECQRKFR